MVAGLDRGGAITQQITAQLDPDNGDGLFQLILLTKVELGAAGFDGENRKQIGVFCGIRGMFQLGNQPLQIHAREALPSAPEMPWTMKVSEAKDLPASGKASA